jgi:4-diphosphocytidyl-2-C-methyl-D-erythritol kinase
MLTFYAPAKINWFLKVLYQREDGFHEIQSLMQKVSLYDMLRFYETDQIIVTSNTTIPVEKNLVYRATKLMAQKHNVQKGASVYLKKQIPESAGLGGGSSDAATTLIGLNTLWGLNLPQSELHAMAETLGSDVPFFLYNPIALVSGRGEHISPCKAEKSVDILLVNPNLAVSTAWAYKNLKRPLTNATDNTKIVLDCIIKGDIAYFKNHKIHPQNDLEHAVIEEYPVIGQIKQKLSEEGAVIAMMSGSGSTVFGVFESQTQAISAQKAFPVFWTATVQTIIN